jgi:hypothetical protein
MKKLNFNTKNNKTLMRIACKKYVTLIDIFRKDVTERYLFFIIIIILHLVKVEIHNLLQRPVEGCLSTGVYIYIFCKKIKRKKKKYH